MKKRVTAASRAVRYAILLGAAVSLFVACPPNAVLTSVEQQVNIVKASGQPVIAPQISPASSSYPDDQSVTITDATPGATIQYTTDGSKPTSASAVYTGPIPVAGNGTHETIIAYANKSGMTDSALATASYIINYNQVYTPVFSQPTGSYAPGVLVSISSVTGGASIRYTLDGSTPTSTSGTVYSGAVTVGQNETITAIAYEAGKDDSNTASATYTVYYYYVYVTNHGSNNVAAYRIDASTGALASISGSPFATGTGPVGLVPDPAGSFLYVVNDGSNNISAYAISTSASTRGALTAVTGSPFAAGAGPYAVAVDPAGKFLFESNDASYDVYAYTINSSTGALTAVSGSPFVSGRYSDSITVDSAGAYVYVGNFGSTNEAISGFAIDSGTGALTPLSGSPFGTGAYPAGIKVAVTTAGEFLYSVSNFNGDVYAYAITSGTGALTSVSGSPFPAGTYPAGIAIDPTGKFAYVDNILLGNVSAYTIGSSNGVLASVSGSPYAAGSNAYDVAVDPTGRFVYVANEGDNTVSAYSINASTGGLSPLAGSPFATFGNQPYHIVTAAMPGP